MSNADESLRDFLSRRKRELQHQVSAFRGQITTLEAELVEIERVQEALGVSEVRAVGIAVGSSTAKAVSAEEFGSPKPSFAGGPFSDGGVGPEGVEARAHAGSLFPSYSHRTLKSLVLQSLVDHFPEGSTASEIREFIANAYRRLVDRATLSPQISRLYADGFLDHGEKPNTWKLAPGVTEVQLKEHGIIPPWATMMAHPWKPSIPPPGAETAAPSDEDATESSTS